MKAATVRIQILSDSIGAEWNDIDAAGEAYADFLEGRLSEALQRAGFATYDVSVSYHGDLAGYASRTVWADTLEDEQELEAIVQNEAEAAWAAFCDSDSSRGL